jgi:dTDP-4-dehydrorhamnose 3,5-epimerase
MKILPTAIPGLFLAHSETFTDHRGEFARLFCEQELATAVGQRRIVQVNRSCTRLRGAVRGMHYQRPPHAEMKLVRCIRGAVWDVAVDLRSDSPTFLQWHAEELTPENGSMLAIPEGCAHGFQVLMPESELLYLHTASYMPESEDGVAPDDPALAIAWPLPIIDLSARDRQHPPISPSFHGVEM